MAERRKTPKQNEINRFICANLMRGDAAALNGVTELGLAEKFNTTRVTVHSALKSFIKNKSLIRIAGRRGLFPNPEYKETRSPKREIGVILPSGDDKLLNIGSELFTILSGLHRKRYRKIQSFHYYRIISEKAKDAFDEIAALPVDGFIWFYPEKNFIPVVRSMNENSIPVVVIAHTADEEAPYPEYQTILTDFYTRGVKRAKILLSHGCKRPVYCGRKIPGR